MNHDINEDFDKNLKGKFLFDLFMLIVFLIVVFLCVYIFLNYKDKNTIDFYKFLLVLFRISLIGFVFVSIRFIRKCFLIGWKGRKVRFICFLIVESYLISLSLFVIFVKRAFEFYLFILVMPLGFLMFDGGHRGFYPVGKVLFKIIIGIDIFVWAYSYIVLPICFLIYGVDSIRNTSKNKDKEIA